jgi:hypothetical protein
MPRGKSWNKVRTSDYLTWIKKAKGIVVGEGTTIQMVSLNNVGSCRT